MNNKTDQITPQQMQRLIERILMICSDEDDVEERLSMITTLSQVEAHDMITSLV